MSESPDTGPKIVGPDEHSTIAIGRNGDRVVLRFHKAVEWVALDSETARKAAEEMAKCAYAAHYGVMPATGRSQISDEKRNAMVRRISLMLASFARAQPMPSNRKMAEALVDTLLAEVM